MALILLGLVWLTRPTTPPPAPPAVIRVTATRAAVSVISTPRVITPTPLPPTPTIAAITAAAPVPLKAVDSRVFNEALVGQPRKLNPLLTGFNQVDRDLTALIFEGLMTTDAYGAAIPDLADSAPRVSSDGLTYVVSLRQDVLWQDGTRFTSADVAFTLRLMQDPAFPGLPDLRRFWETVELDVIDDFTLRFTLAQPLASFADYLRIGILPAHALAGTSAAGLATHPFNLSPIGTGPYQLERWLGDSAGNLSGIQLALSPNYRSRPEGANGFTFQTLTFRFYADFNAAIASFQRGEVFSIAELPPDAVDQLGALSNLTILNTFKPAFGVVIYNWQNANVPSFRDIHFRQALARSVDRVSAVQMALPRRAVFADNPVLPNSWASDRSVVCTDRNPYDLESARRELGLLQILPPPTATPDGTPRPSTGSNPLRFTLLVQDTPAQIKLASTLVDSWTTLGVAVQPLAADPATFANRLKSGDFEAALVELNLAPAADPDPYSLWRQLPSDGGLNFGGMNDRLLSETVELARRESANGAFRAQLYKRFQKEFCERSPAILLYYPVFAYGVDSRLSGVQLGFMADPSDRFRTLIDWRFP